MVHELIGIEDNKVDLRNIGKALKDQQVFTFATFFLFHSLRSGEHILWFMLTIVLICNRRWFYLQCKMIFLRRIYTRILEIWG